MANNTKSIFSLTDYRKRQLVGLVPERTRETYREYGYFGGGVRGALYQSGFNVSTNIVDRLDFSNDTQTALVRGSLSVPRISQGATGNSNFGYFGGGYNSPPIPGARTNVDRIDYSNDSSTTSRRGDLVNPMQFCAAVGNKNFGYFQTSNVINKIDYSNDLATATRRGALVTGKNRTNGSGNSNFGYFGGGLSFTGPTIFSTVDRIDYSNDSATASVRGPLSLARDEPVSTGNLNFGYYSGGRSPSLTTRIDRISYANDLVVASIRANLNIFRERHFGCGNSNFAFFGGGYREFPAFSSIERLDYSNDTSSLSTRGNLSTGRGDGEATSSHSFGGSPQSSFASNFTFPTVPNAGYFGGGSDGTNTLATIDKVDYANDTSTASVRSALSSARLGLAATGNSNFGYYGAGQNPAISVTYSTVDRLEYSSDTQNAVVRGPLSSARSYLGATGNSNFGYFYGSGPSTSTVDRIDYSTDTSAASVRGPVSLSRGFQENCATGNQNFGYFAGGFIPSISSNVSTIDRVDYANDLMTALARTNLIAARRRLGSFGNNNFGYFAGGAGPFSSVERIDYANDTSTPSFRGNLSNTINQNCGTDNSNFAYSAGGGISTVDRINFSNDTATASVRGPLSTAKSVLTATSPLAYGGAPIYFTNPLPQVLQKQIVFNDANTLDLPFKRVLGSFGYFGGGIPDFSSIVSRLDFSNDTANATQRGPLSNGLYRAGSCGNSNFGYFAGGVLTGNPNRSTVDRIDYSNDISTASIRGTITARQALSGVGNNNFGFFGGSYYQDNRSLIERIDYSNDNLSGIRRGQLSGNRGVMGATGNSNFGYFGGGSAPGSRSTVDRIDYSNDSVTASVRGPLSLARNSIAATGNSNFGYFGGGDFPGNSIVDRINYSNDTSTASVRGPLNTSQTENSATGNTNFGYFSNGPTNRINYSNDTATALSRGNILTSIRTAATTNAANS